MHLRSIEYINNAIRIIDQTRLPRQFKVIVVRDVKRLWQAIKRLEIRGAPALGAAAGLGVYLGIKDSKAKDFKHLARELDVLIKYLGSSRPTARNLFWGLERMASVAVRSQDKPVGQIKKLLLQEANAIIEEDRIACRSIGKYGRGLIANGDSILTVCNAGMLATIDYGTALGVLYSAKAQGKKFKVYACETRPLLQGARLTTWELKKNGIDVTLICDNMAATLMQQGKVNKVITGADRITANGDAANKIGTYSLAVLSAYHKIPFYVAAPWSTFDLSISDPKDIVIEEREPKEVTEAFFKQRMAAQDVKVYNPAFDVTPHQLISALVTDRGLIKPPYKLCRLGK